jgi:hypothetical protein
VGSVARFIAAVFMLMFTFWAFPLFYPLTVAAAAAFGAVAYFALQQLAPAAVGELSVDRFPQGYYAVLAVSLVAFLLASRLDHRLAHRLRPYRWFRHVLRLLAFGALAWTFGSTDVASPFPSGLRFLGAVFESPAHLAKGLVAIIIMHFVIIRASGLRSTWRGMLETLWLRPSHFKPRVKPESSASPA